jgi:SAM-dependent methyltransferase
MLAGVDAYGPSTYGDHHADVYDENLPMSEAETAAAVEALADLARGGRVLELGVGTGRIAVPLAARGLEVHGIEASERMLERLRAQPGGERVAITAGDLADVGVDGPFELVYAVFNTFFELYTEDDQLRCLRNVAARLAQDGRLVLELFVPDAVDGGSILAVDDVRPDRVALVASRHDPDTGTTDSVEVWLTDEGVRLFPLRERALQPDELDRLAEQAGWTHTLDWQIPQRLDPTLETTLFRTVQEALANVARHAGATAASIRVWRDGATVAVEVVDDGVGFDRDELLARAPERGLLVHLESDAVAEAVEEAVLEDLARLLVERRLVARVAEDAAHELEERPAVDARLDGGGRAVERFLDETVPLPDFLARFADDVRARHVGVAARALVLRIEIEDDRLAGTDLPAARVVTDRRLRAVRDDHVAALDVEVGEHVLDHALEALRCERFAVELEPAAVRLRTP